MEKNNKGSRKGKIYFLHRWFLIFILTLAFVGCAQKPPTQVTFTNISQYKSGTQVTITGYLDLYNTFKKASNNSLIRLRDSSNVDSISVWIRDRDYGKDSQPNRIYPLGVLYTKDKLTVWLDDGTQVGFGARVEITGTLRFSDQGIPYINALKIEQ